MARKNRRRNKSQVKNLFRFIINTACIIALAIPAWQFFSKARQINAEPFGKPTSNPPTASLPHNDFDIPPADSLLIVDTNPALASQLVKYPGFNLSFNKEAHVPNWVAWQLTRQKTQGKIPRYNNFIADETVQGCPEKWDYNYSGYDRGHMAPAGDMKWSKDAMTATFYMTNICPQIKSLNTGTWKKLEEKCRQWAKTDSDIIIIAGPILTDTILERIGDTGVAVPARFFKVILSPSSKPIRGIAFIMNNGLNKGGLQEAATTIDKVEQATGHDFFTALPDSIEAETESQCDFHYWSNK